MTDPGGSALELVSLRFRLQSLGLSVGANLGTLWRSAFGVALHQVDGQAFNELYGDTERGRLFSLCPPLRAVRPGDKFELRILLFGPCIKYQRSIVEAVRVLALQGVGRFQERALLLEVLDSTGPVWVFDQGWLRCPVVQDSERWWGDPPVAPRDGEATLAIECLTPVALKSKNEWTADTPSLELWVRRIMGRTALLANAAKQRNPIGQDVGRGALFCAQQARVIAAPHMDVKVVRRKSARSGQVMQWPALKGSFFYGVPQVAALWPLFKWAEMIQVGGKTAFGLGVIRVALMAPYR